MSIKINKVAISKASSEFPLRPSFVPSYGTAGFRAHASLLASTVYRCGLLVACRSIITGQSCGLMITASHNPIEDNGMSELQIIYASVITTHACKAASMTCACMYVCMQV